MAWTWVRARAGFRLGVTFSPISGGIASLPAEAPGGGWNYWQAWTADGRVLGVTFPSRAEVAAFLWRQHEEEAAQRART